MYNERIKVILNSTLLTSYIQTMTSITDGMMQVGTWRQNVKTRKKCGHAMMTTGLYFLSFVHFCYTTSTQFENLQGNALGTTNQPTIKLHKAFDHSSYGGHELVLPYQADSQGGFISNSFSPHRHRRSNDTRFVPEVAHFKFRGYKKDFHLEVTSNEALIASGFSIQSWKNGKIETQKLTPHHKHCHYHGSLRSHANSNVAISLCNNGLSGFLRTELDDYLIEPLDTNQHGQKVHILYKRSNADFVDRSKERNRGKRSSRQDGHGTSNNKTKQHYCGSKRKFQPHESKEDIFLADEFPSHVHKRAIEGNMHRNRYVETLVVVDKKMIRNHGEEKITPYVLTVLNMVTSLYKDASLGNTINIVLVSLLLLHDDQPGLNIDHHADHSLNSFCQWQSTLTTPNGTQHDHAILLTGMDICSWKNEPCDTLGFAPIGGMCSKYRSCTINEDTGLGLAFTVAHESGHSFGMVHDGDGNECKKSSGHVMSPTLSGNNGRFVWSSCSQEYISDFLSSSRASCTEDEPKGITKYQFPSKLPGELYDADKQCQWQFGPRARLCSFNFGKSLCQSIWCHRDERRCETKFLPAADGTPCGNEQWCIRGECINRHQRGPEPVDGSWSQYADYSSCSRTCGGGIQYKQRACDNPAPEHGGKYCEGSSHIYRMCNIQECSTDAVDFRAKQCASYNSRPFRGFYYEWQPYVHTERKEACKLYCMADGFDFYFPLSSKVHDGTQCSRNGPDVCINGVCQKVGCDHVLGSDAKPDACGVCQGNNATCDFVKGLFTEQHTDNDYYVIVNIPAYARHIRIAEVSPSTSYLALRNARFKYYLTGAWTVDWPGNFDIAGTTFAYRRPYNMPEYLEAIGPTNQELVVEILLQGINPGVTYEYTVERDDLKSIEPLHDYTWNVTESECSTSCAGGILTSDVYCLQDNTTEVDNSFCDNATMPRSGVFDCNLGPCPARWVASSWMECSKSCGSGRQKRRVKCMRLLRDDFDKSVKESFCVGSKPRRRRNCNMHDCPARWIPSAWSDCSTSCGDGFMTRSVDCQSITRNGHHKVKPIASCRGTKQPAVHKACNLKTCPRIVQWYISAWSECTVTCGMGRRSRMISCSFMNRQGQFREIDDKECSHLKKPHVASTKPCHRGICESHSGKWQTSHWSQCSQTCGGGTKSRQVQCLKSQETADDCNTKNKPAASQSCSSEPCPWNATPVCIDSYNWCYLVPQHQMCGHHFYGPKCCYSCKHRT